MNPKQKIQRRIRRAVLKERMRCYVAALSARHINTPAEGGDEMDRIARYSNGTCKLIAAEIQRGSGKGIFARSREGR